MEQEIYVIGLNHRTAGVEIREAFALNNCNPCTQGLITPKGPIQEAVTLSTCNRVEILAVGEPDALDNLMNFWASTCQGNVETLAPHIYTHLGIEAVEHVFTVAASLDSMVVGEPQILGQLKEAYRDATKHGSAKVILNSLMHKAFSVAKRVRTETGIASSAVSISYAAVELAKKIFGGMEKNTAMLIGAGEMAELAATHLMNAGIQKILVANRTFERAEELAKRFHGEAIVFEELTRKLTDVDIVISSTGAPEAIIRARDLKPVLKKRKHRPMFFIDIAVPRDVDPDVNSLDNVYLYDIDDLKEVVEENMAQRREEALKAEAIIKSEAERFGEWLESLSLQPTIVALLTKGEDMAKKELQKTLKRLGPDIDPETEKTLEILVSSLVKKFYHEPIVFLKRRTQEEGSAKKILDVTRKIFNLDEEEVPEDAHQDKKKKVLTLQPSQKSNTSG
ncbi:MAG: glutamyl-tRNA reductase [Thermodesulfobacteriota bacterium]|nr:glutamyl-tRNA reductase [Thermodesulfobacteriota bacterium]